MKMFTLNTMICAIILLALNLNTCSKKPTSPELKEEIIINGYLYVGSGVDTVYINKSLNIESPYSNEASAVSSDSVFITVENKTFRLLEYEDKPGAYYLPSDSLIILPGKTYFFKALIGNKIVRASTLAPEQIHINSINTDTSYYPFPNPTKSTQFKISWNKSEYAAGYQIAVISKPPYNLVDFGMEKLVEERLKTVDYDTLKAFPTVTDFPVNIFETSIDLMWIAFCYYGDYTIKVYAADQNLWDLSTSAVVYVNQSSEYEQPTYHIDGGYGIFAAVSVDSVHVFVKKQK
jgi:hypothetical protein